MLQDKVFSNKSRIEDTRVKNHSLRSYVFSSKNLEVQWTACLLDVMRVCEPKEIISSTTF